MSDDVYIVPFQGQQLACKTGLDAVAVKLADAVLSGRDSVSPIDMQRLAAALDRYNRPIAATRLRSQAMAVVTG